MIPLRHEIDIAIADRHGFVDALVDRVHVEQPMSGAFTVCGILPTHPEVIDLLIGERAIAKTIVPVWRPRRPVTAGRDHFAHVDAIGTEERIGRGDVGDLARGTTRSAHFHRHVRGRGVHGLALHARTCCAHGDLSGSPADGDSRVTRDVNPIAHRREDTVATQERERRAVELDHDTASRQRNDDRLFLDQGEGDRCAAE